MKMKPKAFQYMAVLLAILVCYCTYRAVFGRISANGKALNEIIMVMGTAVFLCLFLILYHRSKKWSERRIRTISYGLLSAFAVMLLLFGMHMKAVPSVDLNHLHSEAVRLMESGKVTDVGYFSRYPYQLSLAILLSKVFSISRFLGWEDYRAAGIVFNVICIVLSVYLAYLACKRWKGQQTAFLVVLLCMASPVLYLYAPYYYSDTISMPFSMGALYCYGYGSDHQDRYRKWGSYFLGGVLLFAGTQFRATVSFLLIAILILLVLRHPWKKWMAYGSLFLFGFLAAMMIGKGVESSYRAGLDQTVEFPATHFLMMGTNQEAGGGYHDGDVAITKSGTGYRDKVSINLETIEERIQNMGAGGLFGLAKAKVSRVWSDGMSGASQYLKSMERYPKIYYYTVGQRNLAFRYMAQFSRSLLFLGILLFLVWRIGTKDKRVLMMEDMLCICLFGCMLFYLMWESHNRYNVSFLPWMVLLSAAGICKLGDALWEGSLPLAQKRGFRRSFRAGGAAVLAATCLIAGLGFQEYTQIGTEQHLYRAYQPAANARGTVKRIGNRVITQSFTAEEPFDSIGIKFMKYADRNQEYQWVLKDEDGAVIVKRKFRDVEVASEEYQYFSFAMITPKARQSYTMELASMSKKGDSLGIRGYEKEGYEMLKDGTLAMNGKRKEGSITFEVSRIVQGPYFSVPLYLLMAGAVLALELWCFFWVGKIRKGKVC